MSSATYRNIKNISNIKNNYIVIIIFGRIITNIIIFNVIIVKNMILRNIIILKHCW